jgi:hypothetical protein
MICNVLSVFITSFNLCITVFFNNRFYFNQHMHYNFVIVYTPTYVLTTY